MWEVIWLVGTTQAWEALCCRCCLPKTTQVAAEQVVILTPGLGQTEQELRMRHWELWASEGCTPDSRRECPSHQSSVASRPFSA